MAADHRDSHSLPKQDRGRFCWAPSPDRAQVISRPAASLGWWQLLQFAFLSSSLLQTHRHWAKETCQKSQKSHMLTSTVRMCHLMHPLQGSCCICITSTQSSTTVGYRHANTKQGLVQQPSFPVILLPQVLLTALAHSPISTALLTTLDFMQAVLGLVLPNTGAFQQSHIAVQQETEVKRKACSRAAEQLETVKRRKAKAQSALEKFCQRGCIPDLKTQMV